MESASYSETLLIANDWVQCPNSLHKSEFFYIVCVRDLLPFILVCYQSSRSSYCRNSGNHPPGCTMSLPWRLRHRSSPLWISQTSLSHNPLTDVAYKRHKDHTLFMNVSVMLRFSVIPNSESLHLILQPVCPMLRKSDTTMKYMFSCICCTLCLFVVIRVYCCSYFRCRTAG